MKKTKDLKPKAESRKPFAKKSFGQNFLVDQNYINKIITTLDPQEDEIIIEIGPGRGALTEKLVEKAGSVIAIELDKDLIPLLNEKFQQNENFQLVQADALKIDFSELTKIKDEKSKIKLVANLPYYISTAILQRLIEQREVFSEMILMFQREVVERITAEPGNKERGFLTVLAEAYLETEKLLDIPPAAFRPAPKIWSAVVLIVPKTEIGIDDENLFREIISAGFRQKRKTIFNNLKKSPQSLQEKIEKMSDLNSLFEKSNVQPERRAETLTLEEWKTLTRLLS
jgi:16S rRNA (adenine1518-N6/adenine1519-N6)-dimethyltransferase